MKVMVLSRYGTLAASPRYRFAQYVPSLAARGIHLDVSALLDDAYLQARFSGQSATSRQLLGALGRRSSALVHARRYDLAVLHCELLPFAPAWFERLALAGVPYVFDYDDAIFHKYDMHSMALVRRVYGKKLLRVIRGARSVFAGSGYLADYARAANANVHLVPTVVDMGRYEVKKRAATDKPFTIGWIGSPSTTKYLMLVAPALQRLAQHAPVRLIAVGASPIVIDGVQVDQRAWNEQREVGDLLECDVGIMPLTDDPWTRGKCAFKLIQYMACGLPVIASPVGANRDVVTGECGLFADSQNDWVDAMARLRDDQDLRFVLGARGRERAERHYSLASQSARVADLLHAAAGQQRSFGAT